MGYTCDYLVGNERSIQIKKEVFNPRGSERPYLGRGWLVEEERGKIELKQQQQQQKRFHGKCGL